MAAADIILKKEEEEDSLLTWIVWWKDGVKCVCFFLNVFRIFFERITIFNLSSVHKQLKGTVRIWQKFDNSWHDFDLN